MHGDTNMKFVKTFDTYIYIMDSLAEQNLFTITNKQEPITANSERWELSSTYS